MTAILNSRQPTDPTAWLEGHGDFLYRYAMFRLRDASAAENAVQETLLEALQTKSRYQGTSSERTWLVILMHRIIEERCLPIRGREALVDDLTDDEYHPFQTAGDWVGYWRKDMAPTAWHLDASALSEKIEFSRRLIRCLSNLPQRMALAFTMREIDGLSTDEVCTALGLSRSHLSAMLHHARMRLRHSLEAELLRSDPPKLERKQTMKLAGLERVLKLVRTLLRVPVRIPGVLRLIG